MLKERKRQEAAQTNNQIAILGQDRILPLFFAWYLDCAIARTKNRRKSLNA